MPSKTSKSAFTLVELLVVLGIIAIAASIIVVGTGGGAGPALSSSQRILAGVFKGARGQAVLKNAKARVIIHNDPQAEEKFRRFAGIIYENDGEWIAGSQGAYFSKGVFFEPDLSSGNSGNDSGWQSPRTMTVEYPRANRQNASDSGSVSGGDDVYFYYEFDANGTSNNPNAWAVIQAGVRKPVDMNDPESGVEVVHEDEHGFLKAGLIVRRTGTVTMVDDPEDID